MNYCVLRMARSGIDKQAYSWVLGLFDFYIDRDFFYLLSMWHNSLIYFNFFSYPQWNCDSIGLFAESSSILS